MSKKQLIVDIDTHFVRFTRWSDNQIEQQFHFEFKDKTDFGYKDQLDQFLSKIDFRSLDWDEYSLSWFGQNTTLLPFSIFNETNARNTFRLSFGSDVDEKDIDFNRIPEFTGVNIYEIPLWVKSFFVTRFPRIMIQHEGSHLIRGLFSGATFGLTIYLSFHSTHFLLLAAKNNELKYYNTFEFETNEDVIYHFAHLLQQNEWQQEKGKLHLISTHSTESGMLEDFQLQLSKISTFQHIKIQPVENILAKFHTLCV